MQEYPNTAGLAATIAQPYYTYDHARSVDGHNSASTYRCQAKYYAALAELHKEIIENTNEEDFNNGTSLSFMEGKCSLRSCFYSSSLGEKERNPGEELYRVVEHVVRKDSDVLEAKEELNQAERIRKKHRERNFGKWQRHRLRETFEEFKQEAEAAKKVQEKEADYYEAIASALVNFAIENSLQRSKEACEGGDTATAKNWFHDASAILGHARFLDRSDLERVEGFVQDCPNEIKTWFKDYKGASVPEFIPLAERQQALRR